jgi:hypothetical protein
MRTNMRRILLAIAIVLAASPAAWAQTQARCGFSFGGGFEIGMPSNNDLRDEFPFLIGGELEAKYYLWKPLSLSGDVGFLYGEGTPKREEWHNQWIELDKGAVSFYRAGNADLLLRAEIGRNWRINPYLGGGGGGMYYVLERRGSKKSHSRVDSFDEFVPHYLGLVGVDYNFDAYVAFKFEAKWTFAPSAASFTEQTDLGGWFALIGAQIYL